MAGTMNLANKIKTELVYLIFYLKLRLYSIYLEKKIGPRST